jgi:membrane protease YdiL (CAAX protease family)
MLNIIKKIWSFVFPREFVLKQTFPWNFGQLTKIELQAIVAYVIGTFVPAFLIVKFVEFLGTQWPAFVATLDPFMLTVATTFISFLTGFGSAVWWLIKKLHEANLSFRDAMSLNFKTLGGGFLGFLRALLMAGCAYGVIMLLEPAIVQLTQHFLGSVHDPAAELAKNLNGPLFLGFALLAVVGAPIFEEILFRGFLMNALRRTFREGWCRKILRTDSNADYAAMIVQALAFAGAHLTLTGSPVLALMGFVLAMVYMRSGSLYTAMMLHAMNNATAVVQMYNAKHGVALVGWFFI